MEIVKNLMTGLAAILVVTAMAGLVIGSALAFGGAILFIICVVVAYFAIHATWDHFFVKR